MSAQRQPKTPPLSPDTQLILDRLDKIDGRLDSLEREVKEHGVLLKEHGVLLKEHGVLLKAIVTVVHPQAQQLLDDTLDTGGEPPAPPADAVSEAVDALIALGIKPAAASRIARAAYTEDADAQEIIRRALQSMVK